MIEFYTYLAALPFFAPFFSATTCVALVGFSRHDCLTWEERRLKNILMTYLLINTIVWVTLFCYSFVPKVFVYMRSICLIANILSPILFYRILCFLMKTRQQENFSRFHYLAPIVAVGIVMMWSLPIAIIRTLFMMIYYTLFNIQLIRYYRWAKKTSNLIRKPVRWMVFLICLSLFPVYFSVVALLQPSGEMLTGIWGAMAAMGVFVQLILLTYHIIRRKYLVYTTIYSETSEDHENIEAVLDKSGRRMFSGKLTKEGLEDWFRNKKPYLKTDFKITDVVKEMDVNRTVVSSFINKTYGMNFNRYVNRWRLKEFERLSLLFGNENESPFKLYAQAGFSELRQYNRAVDAERKASGKEKRIENKKIIEQKTNDK